MSFSLDVLNWTQPNLRLQPTTPAAILRASRLKRER